MRSMNAYLRKMWPSVAVVSILLLLAVTAFSLSQAMNSRSVAPESADDKELGSARESEADFDGGSGAGMSAEHKAHGGIVHASEADFAETVLNSSVPVLVDFYADWCGPCRALGPVLEDVARETADAKVVKVNVDRSPRLAARYGVASIPNLVVFRDGEVAARHVGLASKDQLKALLAR
jgi:thioredoxin 1